MSVAPEEYQHAQPAEPQNARPTELEDAREETFQHLRSDVTEEACAEIPQDAHPAPIPNMHQQRSAATAPIESPPSHEAVEIPAGHIRTMVTEIKSKFVDLLSSHPRVLGNGDPELDALRARILNTSVQYCHFAMTFTHVFTVITTPSFVMSPQCMTMMNYQIDQLEHVQSGSISETLAQANMSEAMVTICSK